MASRQEELGLSIILTAENKGMVTAIRQTQSLVTDLQKTFRSFDKLTKFDATDVKAYIKELENLGTQFNFQQKELAQYEQRIAEINTRMDANKNKIQLSEEALQRLGTTKEQLQSLIDGDTKLLVKETEGYTRQQAALELTNQSMNNIKSTLADLTNSVQSNTASWEENIAATKSTLNGLDSELSGVQQRLKAAFDDDEKIDAYNKQLKLLKSKLSQLNTLTDNYKGQQNDLKNKISESSSKIEEYEKELESAKTALKSYDGVSKENSSSYDQARRKVDAIEQSLKNEKATRSQLQTQLSRNATAQKEVNTQLQVTTSEYRSASKNLNILKSNTSTYHKNLEELSRQLEETDNSFEKIDNITKNCFDDKTKLSAYRQELEVLDKKFTILNQEVDQYAEIENELTSQISNNREEVERLFLAYGAFSVEVQAAEDEYERLNEELETNRKNQESVCKESIKLGNQYGNITDEIKSLEKSTDESAQAMESFENKADSLNVALGNLISQAVQKGIEGFKKLSSAVLDAGMGLEESTNELAAVLELSNKSDTVEQLSEYFQELGTSCLYSATELTDNAVTLANAGYTADQIKDSIKAISDLAVGTGESFDSMSTIVVDGLAAFGMEASQAQYFTDVLAKTAISTNTDVAQMGEAFKYCGAIAGQFDYNIEDVGIALGAMANQGIKASTAGTSLRSVISRLANNTSGARDAIEELGVSFYDSEGNARPLIDVIDELRDVYSELTTEEKANLTYTVGGQRAMTGLAAILETSTDVWNDLTEEVSDYDLTVKAMANTRMDGLTGDVTKLKNIWENTGSTLYKTVEPALRKIIQSLNLLMQSEVFKKDIASLANGIAMILRVISGLISVLGEKIISLGTYATAAFASFAAVNKITTNVLNASSAIGNLVTGISNLSSGASGLSGIFGLLTNNISLVSIGAGLAAGAIGLLITAVLKQNAEYEAMMQEQYGISESTQAVIDKNTELAESYAAIEAQRKIDVESVTTEISGIQALVDQYNSYIGTNGQVIAGKEAVADYTLNQLASALGVEKDWIEQNIDANGRLGESIQNVILQKQAEAMLTAYEDQYIAAIQNKDQAQQDYMATLAAYKQQQDVVAEAESTLKDLTEQLTDRVNKIGSAAASTDPEVNNLSSSIRKQADAVVTSKSALGELEDKCYEMADQYNGYVVDIDNYNQMLSSSAEGNYSEVVASADRMASGIGNASTMSSSSLRKQVQEARTNYNDLKSNYENGEAGVTKAQVDEAKKRYDYATTEYNKSVKQAKEAGENTAKGASEGFKSGTKTYISAQKDMVNQGHSAYLAADQQRSPSHVMYGYGQNTAQGAINGINSKQSAMYSAGAALARAANNGYKNTLDIHSPSRVMRANGEYTVEGLEQGIDDRLKNLALKTKEMTDIVTGNAKDNIYGFNGISGGNTNYDNSQYSSSYNITINQQAGEDANALAKRVSELIDRDARRRQLAWQ